ncbi:PF07599 family protein [Leptospira kirschneri]|nr:PF07599 family protein [Leptospira kirschneri]
MKMMNIVLTILTGFFLLETLENLYTSYVEYFLKQTSLDNVQKFPKRIKSRTKYQSLKF